ncbi:unnamed protein product [Cochlearia groenlandica]
MESKRVMMLVTMIMTLLVIENLPSHTEAGDISFGVCYPACMITCKAENKFPNFLKCPFTCMKTCVKKPSLQSISSNKIVDTDYFCKLGCATHKCLSLSSIEIQNAERVTACVDSCSNECTKKY